MLTLSLLYSQSTHCHTHTSRSHQLPLTAPYLGMVTLSRSQCCMNQSECGGQKQHVHMRSYSSTSYCYRLSTRLHRRYWHRAWQRLQKMKKDIWARVYSLHRQHPLQNQPQNGWFGILYISSNFITLINAFKPSGLKSSLNWSIIKVIIICAVRFRLLSVCRPAR